MRTSRNFAIERREYVRLQRRALAAQRKDQSEVCGIAVVNDRDFVTLKFLANNSPTPGRFEITYNQIRVAREHAISEGLHPLASFHSHPITEAIPGEGDLTNAFYKGRELIYDVCGCQLRLWRKFTKRGLVYAKEEPIIIVP